MKLSVCIPVYNVAPYVEKCARSLFGQTYADLELVFVDDATPDDSISVVERVLAEFPARRSQTKILRHERNRGLVAARKTAMNAATGELLAHCDSDDWLDLDFYEKLVARLVETDADVVLSSVIRHVGGRELPRPVTDRLDLSGQEAMRRLESVSGLWAMWNKVFRREVFANVGQIEWPDSIRIGEDACCTMQLLPQCRKVTSVADVCYHYRINARSMTRHDSAARLVADQSLVYDILARNVPEPFCDVPRRYLARSVLYWGVTHGLFSRRDYRLWRGRFESLGGVWDWSDMTLWGQRMMKIVDKSYWASRLVAPFVRRCVDDCL
jgi:glycosyltransferase involved in cell wall biosynthesis